MILKRLTLLIAISNILLISCHENDPLPDPGLNPYSTIVEDAEINAVFADTDNVALIALQIYRLVYSTEGNFFGDLCDEAIVTHFPENKRIIVDFGDGCTSGNGITRKGRVIINYTGMISFPTASITVNFQDYFVNGVKIEGTRVTTNKGIDLNYMTLSFEIKMDNGKLTWTDGGQSNVKISHNRKFFLHDQDMRTEIIGSSSVKSRSGVDFTSDIYYPLVYVKTCTHTGNWIASEGMSFLSLSQSIVFQVDYGQGKCDREITVILEDESIRLTLD